VPDNLGDCFVGESTLLAMTAEIHMTILIRKLGIIILLMAATSCTPTQTPTEPILVDAFFSGYAFLDANGNGEIDPEDTPVENAIFIVTIPGGYEVGDTTDESGNAFITVPGGVEYPVTLRMEPPTDSDLKLIGPSSIIYPSNEPAEFLFQSETK
jgi:hypothetical protein